MPFPSTKNFACWKNSREMQHVLPGPAVSPKILRVTISRLVHFTWKDKFPPKELFPSWWRESWLAPGWTAKLWTDEDIANWVKHLSPQTAELMHGYPNAIMRADAFRYFLLRDLGGLYVDLDMVNLAGPDWLETLESPTLAEQQPGILCNAFLWFPHARDPFWNDIEDALWNARIGKDPVSTTGPRFLSSYASERAFTRLPRNKIYPLEWDDLAAISAARNMNLQELKSHYPDSNAIHIWTSSWFSQCEP